MSATAQCQNPLRVGASGSYQVTAKLSVSAGKPDQDSCGERSSPPAPLTPETCGGDSGCPSTMSVLVSVKEGTLGRNAYGNSGRLVVVIASPSVEGHRPPAGNAPSGALHNIGGARPATSSTRALPNRTPGSRYPHKRNQNKHPASEQAARRERAWPNDLGSHCQYDQDQRRRQDPPPS